MSENYPVSFDAAEDDLDSRLAEIGSGESFVTKWQRKKKEKPQLDEMSFYAEFVRYWWIYLLLGLSAIFTGTLGFVVGLAPYESAPGVITFHDDTVHIFLAVIYMFAFIGVTEFAFALGKWLFFVREQDNGAQTWTMLIWMLAAGVSILYTGYAGGAVIASFIEWMTEFSSVNMVTQQWIAKAIPTLFTFYTILGAVYILSSRENIAKRGVRAQQKEADLAHATRLQITKQWGREQVMKEQIKRYMRMVDEGVLSQREADYAIDQGLSLRELEEKLRRDLDGDGAVGSPNGKKPAATYASETPDFTKRRNSR